MGEKLEAGEFWLPPGFFIDDNVLSDTKDVTSSSSFSFSSAFSSLNDSVFGFMTETESDEDDYTLTQRLESLYMSTSPLTSSKVSKNPESLHMFNVATGLPVGPTIGLQYFPLSDTRMSRTSYQDKFLFLTPSVEHERYDQITHQNHRSFFGGPSVDDILLRKVEFRQHIISAHRRVLSQNQIEENARYIRSSLRLPQFSRPCPLVQHQINQMSTGASLGMLGRKQASAGTGVFIPRPTTNLSNAPKKSVVYRSTAQRPPRFYQAMNKNTTPSAAPAQVLTTLDHDALTVGSNKIPIQKIPGFQLDGIVKHEQVLPREWLY